MGLLSTSSGKKASRERQKQELNAGIEESNLGSLHSVPLHCFDGLSDTLTDNFQEQCSREHRLISKWHESVSRKLDVLLREDHCFRSSSSPSRLIKMHRVNFPNQDKPKKLTIASNINSIELTDCLQPDSCKLGPKHTVDCDRHKQ
jgi:hypothetical protein